MQLDKKLETASRESDEKVERIQRKLDEAILQQQKDKKTNEETLDAFQADIDALEKEKQDLKVSYWGVFYWQLKNAFVPVERIYVINTVPQVSE